MFGASTVYVPPGIPYIAALIVLIIAGGFAVNVPLKPLLTVNISVSVIAAAVLFPVSIWKSDDLIKADIAVLFLMGLVLLIILLPNIMLFIKFRKQKEANRFRNYIKKSALLFLCHIPSWFLIILYAVFLRVVVMH